MNITGPEDTSEIKPPTFAIYARSACHDGFGGDLLEQIHRCVTFGQSKGLQLAPDSVFSDPGVCGLTENPTGLSRLLRTVARHPKQFTYLITIDIWRVSRDFDRLDRLTERLKEHGLRMYALAQGEQFRIAERLFTQGIKLDMLLREQVATKGRSLDVGNTRSDGKV
jgi:hypothetical protein